MKIMVTGGAGFIGSALARHLVERTDHEVLVIDKLTYAGNLASLASLQGHARFSFSRTDICDRQGISDVFASFEPDAVCIWRRKAMSTARLMGPRNSLIRTLLVLMSCWRPHSSTWRRLIRWGRDFRFLHVSTDEVYGALTETGFFTEDTRYDPKSPYSATKAASDHLVRAWGHTYGLPVLLTNCSNNYGPHQFPEKLIPLTSYQGLSW